MKRKTDGEESRVANGQPESKKRALSSEEAAARFREGLFEPAELQKYTKQYAQSAPYVFRLFSWFGLRIREVSQLLTLRDHQIQAWCHPPSDRILSSARRPERDPRASLFHGEGDRYL